MLIVEDDEDSRFVYSMILREYGFHVETAVSGDEGLAIALAHHPRAILMDVSIPGIDGWTVTERLKADPTMSSTPIIIISAHAFPEDLQRAEDVGCDSFLTKPCDPKRVLEEVRRFVDTH